MSRESAIERRFREGIARKGGWSMKLVGVKGVPDRLVVFPGRVAFVELKGPRGRLSPAQDFMIARLRALGAEVVVLRGDDEVREWLES